MIRTSLRAVLMASMFAVCGCAPWASQTTKDYVTVDSEAGHDAGETRKLYDAARKQMTKHVRGEKCDLTSAEKHLQQALATDVRFGPAHHSLGVLYFWQKKLYLAAWEFEYAARLMPDRFEPLNNLGLVYESAGKLDQAKMYYALAREKTQLNREVIGNLARVSSRTGRSVDEIRPLLEDVLATDTRPEWRRWARELLGVHPISSPPDSSDSTPVEVYDTNSVPSRNVPSSAEELPLIAPPPPDTASPSGTIDQTIKHSFELDPSLDLKLGAALQDEPMQH